MLKNSATKYGTATKTFHWTLAVIVIGMLALGLYMSDLPKDPFKFKLYFVHKSFGVVVLTLMLCRLVWHQHSKKPDFLASLHEWEKRTARVIHWLLYIALIAMPLSGWALSSAANSPVSFFSLFDLPHIVHPDHDLGHLFREIHGYLGDAIIALLALHIAGALKHFFIDKDKTLQRMLPFCNTGE